MTLTHTPLLPRRPQWETTLHSPDTHLNQGTAAVLHIRVVVTPLTRRKRTIAVVVARVDGVVRESQRVVVWMPFFDW